MLERQIGILARLEYARISETTYILDSIGWSPGDWSREQPYPDRVMVFVVDNIYLRFYNSGKSSMDGEFAEAALCEPLVGKEVKSITNAEVVIKDGLATAEIRGVAWMNAPVGSTSDILYKWCVMDFLEKTETTASILVAEEYLS